MAKLGGLAVAKLLAEYGRRSALRGGNPYRARAYRQAAENILALTEPLENLVAGGRLREIPGVGDAIADIVSTLHKTGTHPTLERMREEVPEGVLEMVAIPGLRPEKALKIHQELGIASLDELEKAARQDRLKSVKGLGPALQAKVLQGIEIHRRSKGQRHIHRAAELLNTAEANLKKSSLGFKHIQPAGDFRRGCELVSDLSIVAEVSRSKIDDAAAISDGELNVQVSDAAHYGAALLWATGSKAHLDQLCAYARSKGYSLDRDGLHKAGKIVASKTEAEIYSKLALAFIEPELREGRGEIRMAEKRALPLLVTDKDIRGILHAHTESSDGLNTLEQMANATRKLGYSYFGVADHSKSAQYAGGLSIEEITEQHAEADRLNAKYGAGFRIFKGIESDILADGSLDYPDDVMDRFDFVVASVHSRFRMNPREQTDRILRAVAHPRTTIFGHMTGRQLLRRPGYEVDVERVLKACAKHRVAVEINANPWRLDLDWRWHGRALDLNCMMSINPDAHSTAEIQLTHWGVEMARKGGVPKERVLNCLELPAFEEFLSSRRRAGGLSRGRTRRAPAQKSPRKVTRP
jgi:DNA polymerase (family 10)